MAVRASPRTQNGGARPQRLQSGDGQSAAPSALYLTELFSEINAGAGFLDQLSLDDVRNVRRHATPITLPEREKVFVQGDPHRGIFLIESGRVRTYYTGPSGKEVTLAYWTPGHFVGGPEVFGTGFHMWSATTLEPSRLSFLPGGAVRHLVETMPTFAVCLIEALAAKGKCYSALVQMLGTRSVLERLAQLLLILAEMRGERRGGDVIIRRDITFEQVAMIVGSTRQWVTSAFQRFEDEGTLTLRRDAIVIHRAGDLTRAG